MKSLFTFLFSFITAYSLISQNCDGQRYYDAVFDDVDSEFGIRYGEAPQPNILNPNAMQELTLNFFEPAGDSLEARPLIIWAFGGSFVAGSSLSPDILQLCDYFSKRGYVNASIEYRLTTDLLWDNSNLNAYRAVRKSMSDMKAAVRFFYKDAVTDNKYRVDTTRVYVGGVSAGAIAAVHLAYLDEESEVPQEIYQEFVDNGWFEGNSGNPGYGSEIAGVINLSGGIKETEWINEGDKPIVSLHGTEDGTVPYGTEIMTTLGVNFEFSGSASVHERMDELGIENEFFTWYGAGHVPFTSDGDYMDTTQWFVRDFLYDQICENATPVINLPDEKLTAKLIPNPSQGYSILQVGAAIEPNVLLEIIDVRGRKQTLDYQVGQQEIQLYGDDLPPGMYFVRMMNSSGQIIWTGKWSLFRN